MKYKDVISAFDIETTSTSVGNKPLAWMYIWMWGVNGKVTTGRTWEEWREYYDKLVETYQTTPYDRLIVYIHNLGFEYEFIKDRVTVLDYFEIEPHKPLRVVTAEGIEFRCSYLLSNMSLEEIGNNLTSHTHRKLVGSLDYSLIRHSGTPLTQEELDYCLNDVYVLMDYIEEQKELYGKLSRIPYTNTGRVRRYCRANCLYMDKDGKRIANMKYIDLMKHLTIKPEEYMMLHNAFAGGDTHANPLVVGDVLHDVIGYDMTSAYPSVMISEMYPMGAGYEVKDNILNIKTLNKLMRNKLLVFKVHFKGLSSKIYQHHFISRSRCESVSNYKLDNGRIVSADELTITITSVDWTIIKDCYKWEAVGFSNVWAYPCSYLPKPLVESIITLFNNKVKYKGVNDTLYRLNKTMLNSVYGMMVQHIDDLDAYNSNRSRFTYYPWGVFVTAYVRRRLWDAVLAMGDDFVYCDTDSCKFAGNHMSWFTYNNNEFRNKIHNALEFNNITLDTGNIGEWHLEGVYKEFKTLGAKRYLVLNDDNTYELTNAGVGVNGIKALGNDPFKAYNYELVIPPEYSGKLCHTYIGSSEGDIVDYLGNLGSFHEYGGVHLRPIGYTMSVDDEWLDWLFSVSYRRCK